jgi:hypothetical protein
VLDRISIPVTTTGSAGSATGSASATVIGAIVSVALDYHASAPATTDVTISQAAPLGNILVVSNSATDTTVAPRRTGLVDSANAAITGSYDTFYLNGPVTVSVAQSNALDPAVTAVLTILR